MIRTIAVSTVVFASNPAHAQLRDPVPVEELRDGGAVELGGDVVADAGPGRDAAIAGDLAGVIAWTRAGVDHTQGVRGPRWTNRWGALVAARAAGGSGERPLELEVRSEIALYAASIGQTVQWRVEPRWTDRLWWQSRGAVVGAFVDFPGLGMVKDDSGDELGCEMFPIYLGASTELDAGASRTVDVEYAVVRAAGRPGDLRLIDHRATVRRAGNARAIVWDFEAISARRVELAKHSVWRMSGGIGTSLVQPLYDRSVSWDMAPHSIMPLVRIGIEHRGAPVLQARSTVLGRPLVDDVDFGAELATLHRFVDGAGVDAGGQLVAWTRRVLMPRVALRAEAMTGLARRVLSREPDSPDAMPAWLADGELALLARVELALTAELAYGASTELRVWFERSDREQPALRANHGVQAGLSWHL